MNQMKERIKKRFCRAAATYDEQAVIQFKVADRLLTLLGQHAIIPPEKVLEIGCCTGLLTSRLVKLYPGTSKLYVNDLVPDFKNAVTERIPPNIDYDFLAGDIETISLPADLDLVISSSTFHWLDDLESFFTRLKKHMSPEGILAFSMYSTGNLAEIRELTGIGLDYLNPEVLEKLTARHFQVLNFEEELITFKFTDPVDILHHLRDTGVNALDSAPWNRRDLHNFIRRYRDRFTDGELVSLTYHPVYCIAQNRA